MEIAVQMLLKEIWLVLGFVFIIVNNVALASIDEHFQPLIPKPNSYKKIEEYEYILPQRKVTSCPSFASFKFACENNHLISIDSLVFAPTMGGDLASGTTAATKVGECESDWRAECHDDSGAFEYAARECSSREQCSLISYQLRSRTKCAQHQVVSIFYKCIPSWEITTVPIKCDICKNVTVNSIKDNFGFIHSAWYPKLYPRVTCHSLIQNRPEHFIVVYSVSGSIGLDRILIESLDNGARPMREILTGNLTTRLVITSANDVNITVLTEDTYYFEQRRFLLYFYIVPKCYIILCSNVTGYPQIGYYPTTTRPQSVEYYNSNYPAATTLTYASPTGLGYNPTTSSSISSQPSPPSAYSTYSSSSSSYYSSASSSYVPQPPPPAAPLPPASYGPQSTYAPPLIADYHNNKHHSKISDAWLAAILALIYALLMVFAVLVAIYCRRRRRRRLVQENNIHIFSPSCVSSSHMLNNPSATITRSMTQSQISIHDHSIPSGYLTTSASYGSGAVIGIPQLCGAGMIAQGSEHNMIYSQVNNNSRRGDDMLEYTTGTSGSMPTYQRQLNVNTSTEFDNYSQVLSDDYEEEEMSCDAMNYGDIDVTNQFTHLHHPHHHALYSRSGHAVAAARCYQNLDAMTTGPITDSPPYSLKTNTQHGQILACSNAAPGNLYSAAGCNKDYSNKNMYRAVEYTKGPQMETVRVHNSHDNDCFNSNGEQIVDEIHTTTTTTTTTRYEEYLQKYDDLNATTSIVSPAKVTTTESVTYRRDANGDLLEETMTTTTAGVDPPPGSPAQGALALPPHQPKTIIESGCSEPYTSITNANNNNHRSSSFVVKLYPSDEQEKEVQEMTMYVESPNATVATSTSYKSF